MNGREGSGIKKSDIPCLQKDPDQFANIYIWKISFLQIIAKFLGLSIKFTSTENTDS